MNRYESNRSWWWTKTRGRDLYFAAVDNRYPAELKPKPDKVDHEFSCGFGENIRYYAFAVKSDRDEFVLNWVSAVVCRNPFP